MFHGRQAQPSAFLLGGVVRFKNALKALRGNAWSVVPDGDFDRQIKTAPGGDVDVAPSAFHGLTGILQNVDECLVYMPPLHEERRKVGREITVDTDGVICPGWKHSFKCSVQFL